MRNYLYYVLTGDHKHYFYDYERAVDYFNLNGGKIYAYTKDLFPFKALVKWA